MKIRLLLIISILMHAIVHQAQTILPESSSSVSSNKVKSLEFLELPSSDYAVMSNYWKNRVNTNTSDSEAWLNYYKAARFQFYSSHSRELSQGQQIELNGIIANMNAAIPNSFAFHYASYLNGNKNDESFDHLRAAYQMNPNDQELHDDMLCDAIIHQNTSEMKRFAELVSKSGMYNAAEVEYNRNVLSSIEQNAVLVTYGNMDSYPVVMMQLLQTYRNDVFIICIDWLGSATYTKLVASKLGIKGEVTIDKIFNTEKYPTYLSLTLPPEILRKYSNRLYCTGLAMKYSRKEVRNLESLVYNWEQLFIKSKMMGEEPVNRNYIVPLILLHDYYTQHSMPDSAAAILQQLNQISQRFGTEQVVKKHVD